MARGQQPEGMRRIGVLVALAEDDPESSARRAAFEQALQASGWTVGRNIRIEYRWGAFNPARTQKLAAELAALAPDVILEPSNVVLAPMLQAAPTTPIVFTQVIDPLGSGFVESMARPGGNVTGFTQFEYSLAGKWLELFKEIAPRVTRVAVLRDSTRGPGIGQFAVIQAMALPHAVELTPINARDPTETKIRRMQPSQLLCASGRMRSWLAPTRFSASGGCNLPTWRRATRFPRHIRRVKLPKWAG